jgi:hypothetical protein
MRSRPARLTLSALAWIALGAAAFFTLHAQQEIDQRRASLRAFEASARDVVDALDDAQAGQQAYVAVGQNPDEWTPKVATYLQTAAGGIDTLRASALSQPAGPSLLDASTAMTQLGNVDRRIRERIAAGDMRAAADTVFSDGADALSSAVSSVDTAIEAEQQAAGTFEGLRRRTQIYAMGGGAAAMALIVMVLGLAAPAAHVTEPEREEADAEKAKTDGGVLAGLSHDAPVTVAPPAALRDTTRSADALTVMAGLCTEFGRLREAAQLTPLLAQAAGVMNARGLIVWLGSPAGADLRAVLAHGYTDSTLARIPTIPRSADNVAAAAYRSSELQIINGQPGGAHGTVVAPLLAADGCIGALTAEIRDGSEASPATRALALILAAQLASVLAAAADSASAAQPETASAIDGEPQAATG